MSNTSLPNQEELEAARATVEQLLSEVLPVKGARVALQGPFSQGEAKTTIREYGIFGVLGLMTTEADGSIRDLKEQEVLLVPSSATAEMSRVEAYLRGWGAALVDYLHDLAVEKVETRMPMDFADHKVLALKRPKNADDFAAAFRRRWKVGA